MVFTFSADPRDKNRALALGVQEYIIKPSTVNEYMKTIRDAVERWLPNAANYRWVKPDK